MKPAPDFPVPRLLGSGRIVLQKGKGEPRTRDEDFTLGKTRLSCSFTVRVKTRSCTQVDRESRCTSREVRPDFPVPWTGVGSSFL